MNKSYPTQLFRFNAEPRTEMMTLQAAIDTLRADQADTLLMDVVPPAEIDAWWQDDGFASSPFTKNAHHAGTVATAVTMGQFQREIGPNLVIKAAEYFTVAARINDDLRRSRFVRLFTDGLGASALTMESGYPFEFLMATRRIYDPHDQPFNFAPHCDDIRFGRDAENWPMRKHYADQLSVFLTAQVADNNAGFVMWDYRPASRPELDLMHADYARTGTMGVLDGVASFVVRPQPGQLTLFQCKKLHAIERCSSQRRTMGLFLLDDGPKGWRFFD
jgi:hypothetical protein